MNDFAGEWGAGKGGRMFYMSPARNSPAEIILAPFSSLSVFSFFTNLIHVRIILPESKRRANIIVFGGNG
jgi:hypothetical protein